MLSSLQALAGATPASRSASAFQPKFKPRARPRGGSQASPAAEENAASTPQAAAAQEAPVTPPAPVPTPPTIPTKATPVSPPTTPSPRVDARRQERPRTDATSTPRVSPPSPAPEPSAAKQRPGKEPASTSPQNFAPSPPSSSNNPTASEAEAGESSKKRKRVASCSAPRRRRVENVDEAIDPGKMTFRDIIRLADAKDRKKQKEEAVKKQEQAAVERPEKREREQKFPPAPKVQVVDGNIVIDEESMKVDARELNSDDIGSYRRIEESSSKLNYHSHMVKVPRERWKPEETETFYKAVQQFGTDFAVIERLFPGKSRRQIKNKYKKEERSNPRRLTEYILKQRPGDFAYYEELVEKLKASAAEKAGVDEFDFTWDVNAPRAKEQQASEAGEEGVEEAGEEAFENDSTVDEVDEEMTEQNSSPKKEEPQRSSVEFEAGFCSEKLESKDDEFIPPPLFAYEMEF